MFKLKFNEQTNVTNQIKTYVERIFSLNIVGGIVGMLLLTTMGYGILKHKYYQTEIIESITNIKKDKQELITLIESIPSSLDKHIYFVNRYGITKLYIPNKMFDSMSSNSIAYFLDYLYPQYQYQINKIRLDNHLPMLSYKQIINSIFTIIDNTSDWNIRKYNPKNDGYGLFTLRYHIVKRYDNIKNGKSLYKPILNIDIALSRIITHMDNTKGDLSKAIQIFCTEMKYSDNTINIINQNIQQILQ